jgi:twinkle protein
MKKLYYYAQSKKCDFIVLDHLSIVVSATDTNNERKAIDTLMTQLAKLVVQTGVGLIQIVHLKRPSGDKSFAKGGEVELSDLRGSAALEQLSWNVIGLERDQQGDSRDFSRIRVLKNRTCGFTGACDTLKYNPQTGRLLPFTEPVEELDTEALSAAIG